MTNYKWFVQNVNTMTIETLSNMLGCPCSKICDDNDSICDGTCQKAWIKWFNKEHIEPMPELKNGMFVKIKYHNDDYDEPKLGVFVDGDVIYHDFDHTFDTFNEYGSGNAYITKEDIIAIYDTKAFCLCNEENCIWKKD